MNIRTNVGGQRLVNVDQDTWVAGIVCAREADGVGLRRAASSDRKLVAGHVELRSASTRGTVQSDGLRAKEVVTRGDILGDGECPVSTVVVEDLVGEVVRVVGDESRTVDLEPVGGSALCRRSVVDLGQVDLREHVE